MSITQNDDIIIGATATGIVGTVAGTFFTGHGVAIAFILAAIITLGATFYEIYKKRNKARRKNKGYLFSKKASR